MARRRTIALLLAAGALISGVTMLRGIDPFDEGFMLAATDRIGRGQVLYRDFTWPYGPGHPYLLDLLNDLFGRSLLWWRIVRVICDTSVAVLVYVLVRRRLSPRWAVAAWLCAACAMAQPVSANPFPVALALGLGALVLVTAERPVSRAWLWAGLLTGLAAAWRLDFGLYAAGAVGATLLLRGGGRRALVPVAGYALTAFLAGLAAYAPFVLTVGPHDLYQALVGDSARERDYWTLPFPWRYDGAFSAWPPGTALQDGKDVLEFYVPLLVTAGAVLAGVGWLARLRSAGGRTFAWLEAGALVFGAGALLYLLSRVDEFHANPGIVALAIALPLGAAALRSGSRPERWLALASSVVFALLTLYGVANRVSAVLRPLPYAGLDVDVADGVRARPTDARALPRVVRTVRRLVPPGQPIYVTTRRSDVVRYSDPLLYVLTDRPNVLDRDVGLFARPATQRRIVDTLRRKRPRAVIRWTDPISSEREPNLRGRISSSRAVDSYLSRAYRPVDRRGYYVVLARR